jgi:hypothetical protein
VENILNQILADVTDYAPRILAALAILVVGWLVARGISAGVKALLRRTNLDDRLAGWLQRDPVKQPTETAGAIAKVIFYLLMLFVLVAFFQALGLTLITEPMNNLLNKVLLFAPNLLGAIAILAVALITATVLRLIIRKALEKANLDKQIGAQSDAAQDHQVSVSQSVGDAIYWLVLLLFLPAILGALGIGGLLAPVQNLTERILGYLPNLVAGGLVLLVGWFVARIVQRIVTSLLAAAGADRLTERIGLQATLGSHHLSGILGSVLYVLILIPVLIAALNALAIEAVTAPASQMLQIILGALPNLFAAGIILIFSFVVGRVVAELVVNLLAGIGFDRIPAHLGLTRGDAALSRPPSQVAGTLILVAIMLFAVTEAANLLGFTAVSGLVSQFVVFAGHVLFGLVILGLGLWLANVAGKTIRAISSNQAPLLAGAARSAILILTTAMALRQMGLANEIINLAFGLLLGAVAVAVAIAFGLGGRETAAAQLQEWRRSLGPEDKPLKGKQQSA